MADHESDSQRAIRRTRVDARDEDGTVVSYTNEAGEALALTGDDDAPYIHVLGRTANANGTSPVTSEAGAAQRVLVDDQGRVFITTTAGGLGVLQIEGDIAHDAADSSAANPVKVGGTAATQAPTSVAVGDRVQAYFDTEGRQVTDTDRLIAGEDPVHHLLLAHPALIPHEQHAAAVYSSATAASNVGIAVKASGGRVFQVRAIAIAPAGARYLMIFNKATAPTTGDTPVWRALLPATGGTPGEVQDNWEDIGGLLCGIGIGVAVSTTPATLTLIAEDVYFHITYK